MLVIASAPGWSVIRKGRVAAQVNNLSHRRMNDLCTINHGEISS
jgi:hypothetical protein